MRGTSASAVSRYLLRHRLQAVTTTVAGSPNCILKSSQRSFAKLASPGNDPLEVLRSECFERNLCDESGFRLAGVHWVFHVAVAAADESNQPPNLRTVGVQRVSEDGIDFVVKTGTRVFASTHPVSILHSQGKYIPGQQAEQWRADGHVERITLGDVLHKVPHYTIAGMVASTRIAKELAKDPQDRIPVNDKSHLTEIMQQTRIELENGDVSKEELAESITALRFQPDRIERMVGGPDAVLWDRWEWERSEAGDCPEGKISWNEPKWLLPH